MIKIKRVQALLCNELFCNNCNKVISKDKYKLKEYGWQQCVDCGEYLVDNRLGVFGL